MSTSESAKELVIFLHGYASTPLQYKGLIELFKKRDREVYAPNFESQPFTSTDPDLLVDHIVRSADRFVSEHPNQRILLCAHSMGCVFLKAAILKWAGRESSPIGQAIRSNGQTDYAVRALLLASTNRGFRPEGIPSWGLELAHRWYWLMLILVGWCLLIKGSSLPSLQIVAAGATVSVLGCATYVTFRNGAGSLASLVGLLMASTWLALIFYENWYLNVAAVALTALTSLLFSKLLNYTCSATVVLALLASLLASSSFLSPSVSWVWPAIVLLAWPAMVWPWNTGLLLEHVLFGSDWLTRNRLEWLEVFDRPVNPVPYVPTIHLFGDRDRLVDEGDHEELAYEVNCYEFKLEDAHHKDFMLTARPGFERLDQLRHGTIRAALDSYLDGDLVESIRFEKLSPKWHETAGALDLADGKQRFFKRKLAGNVQPEHVIFLIHGIRDFGEWQDSLAAKVRAVGQQLNLDIKEVVIIRYGYFNAFQFLLWGERDRASRLFLDAYAQARSRFPNAHFSVAAHSNGTFVVANALLRSAAMRLDNVYFAGSVVWNGFFGNRAPGVGYSNAKLIPVGRIKSLRSDCASKDWPVGALCWWLSFGNVLRWGMIGTGGVDGFQPVENQLMHENKWLDGGHGEGVKQRRHEDIAEYLLTGKVTDQKDLPAPDRKYLIRMRCLAFLGLLGIAALYALTILTAPLNAPVWGVVVGSLLTIVVVRIAMAI